MIEETEKNWVDRYLKSHFYGYVAGQYDKGCHLYFKDINNFIQNVGRFSDVEIMHYEGELLLNTAGTYVNRIWPELSWYDRNGTETMEAINYIAKKVGELRKQDGLAPAPLPKINKFMKEVFGQETVDQNMEFVKCQQEAEMEEGVMEMTMT